MRSKIFRLKNHEDRGNVHRLLVGKHFDREVGNNNTL